MNQQMSNNNDESPDLVTLLFASAMWFHFTGNELGAQAAINASLHVHNRFKWLNNVLDEVDEYC